MASRGGSPTSCPSRSGRVRRRARSGGRASRPRRQATLVGAVVQSSNEVVEPGVVLSTTPTRNRLIMGNVVAGLTTASTISQRCWGAGYDAYETPDIRRELWNKMALWLAVAPTSALTGLALDRLVSDPGGFALMTAVMRETVTRPAARLRARGRRGGAHRLLSGQADAPVAAEGLRARPRAGACERRARVRRDRQGAGRASAAHRCIATLCRLKFEGRLPRESPVSGLSPPAGTGVCCPEQNEQSSGG